MSNRVLENIGRQINRSLERQSKMKIGATLEHPDGRTVKVINGCYLDPIYGRVSNWWTWQEINEDGSLGPEESGYGW